jgi:hypothetical protein
MSKARDPEGSLLAAMLGEHAPPDVRRTARRIRAEGAPAVAVDARIAALARGLSSSEVSHSPAVVDVLPPLFWIEAQREGGAGVHGVAGWLVERKGTSLAVRGFDVLMLPEAVPDPRGTATLAFPGIRDDDGEISYVRGLIAAVSLPELLAQMGEAAPVLVLPADALAGDAGLLRGIRLSVAIPPDAAPG